MPAAQRQNSGDVSYPSELNIVSAYAFADNSGVIDEESVKAWESYMSDKYGFQIHLESYASSGNGMQTVVNNIDSKSGMVELYSDFILKLINEDKILPLDDYLADNKVWNALPEDFRKRFEYNGRIWAIPKSTGYRLTVTSIRTDWLANVNQKLPTTQEELYQVGTAFLKGDPDQDQNSGNNYLLGRYYSIYSDILASFGIYIDSNKLIPLAYDPTEDCILDAMLKPQAKEALQYLKNMVDNGMIDPLSFTNPSAANSNASQGLYGTVNGWVNTGKYSVGVTWAKNNALSVLGRNLDLSKDEDYQYATGLYEALPPLSAEYPVAYTDDWSGYVLPKGTKDPGAVVNAFIDITLGSGQKFLDAYIGIPESYTQKDNNVFVMNKKGNAPYPMANIMRTPSFFFDTNYAVLTDGEYSENAVKLSKETSQYIKDYIDRYTKTNQLVKAPVLYQVSSTTLDTYYGMIYNEFGKLIQSLNNSNISVDEALEQYRRNVKSYQIDEILKEANQNIGKEYKSQQ